MDEPPANQNAAENAGAEPAATPRRERPSGLAVYGAVTSTIALLATILSLWWTTFRGPVVMFDLGSGAAVATGWYGKLGMLLPMTIRNTGARSAAITDFDLALTYLPSGKTLRFRPHRYYAALGDQVTEGDPFGSSVLRGGEAMVRNLVFQEGPGQPGLFNGYGAGRYRLILRYRLGDDPEWSSLPPRDFDLPDEGLARLNNSAALGAITYQPIDLRADRSLAGAATAP